MPITILISGATGLIGRRLVDSILQQDSEVLILTQNIRKAQNIFPSLKNIFSWKDIDTLSTYKIDAIINLAGTNLDEKRWNKNFKEEIYSSRIKSTQNIVGLIEKLNSKPEVLINASGVDFYGDTGDKDINENSPNEDSFIGKLVFDWEQEAFKAKDLGVRVVCLRTGFVIARESKAFKKMVTPYKMFVGGYPGNGKQFLSWIDIEDLVRIYLYCIENKSLSGSLNASSPNPLRMKEFSRFVGNILHRPRFFTAPAFILKILFGEISRLILAGRKALPEKLLNAGFRFNYPDVANSLSKELNL